VAAVTTRIWYARGEAGEFTGEATYDDVSGHVDSIAATNTDSVPHDVIVTWKGQEFVTTVPAGQAMTYTPPANVKWGQDQFDIRTV
jgi:hypothetical protein